MTQDPVRAEVRVVPRTMILAGFPEAVDPAHGRGGLPPGRQSMPGPASALLRYRGMLGRTRSTRSGLAALDGATLRLLVHKKLGL
jgi:hypothetical protein